MTELVILRADGEKALVDEIARLISFLDRVPDVDLADVAYTCSLTCGESVIAVIAEDVPQLRAKLSSARDRLSNPSIQRIRDKSGTYFFREHLLGEGKGKLAFVYPGVMSFYPDMMRDIAITFPECRDVFDELEEAMRDNCDFTPSSFIFPPAPYYRHDADIFKSGAYAQALVATYTGCAALSRLVRGAGIVPEGVVGFAGGDLAAMMRSGVAGAEMSRPERVNIIRSIYEIVVKAVNHGGLPAVAMVTVVLRRPGEADEIVNSFPTDKVALAVSFTPRQKTYAVQPDFEEEFMAAFAKAGIRTMKLELDRPFNTAMCERLVPAIKKFAASKMKHSPVYDIYSCATADRVPSQLRAVRSDMAERWARPVLFDDTVRRMYEDGYRVFIEVGPRGLMTAAIEDTLKSEPHAAIALNSIHRRGILQLQHAFGQLSALGAKMDMSRFYLPKRARRLDFDAAISMEVRKDSEMRLSRNFPKLTLLSDNVVQGAQFSTEPRARGGRAAARAAVIAQQARRQRQFDFGAMNPLVSDADILQASPGVSTEIAKTFKISEMPFIGDWALGTSQLSYSDPNLKGLVLLTIPLGAEIMAETAAMVVPNRNLVRIEDFNCRRIVSFEKDVLKLYVRAERVASKERDEIAVKVQLRDDSPNSGYTWPVMEAVFCLAAEERESTPVSVEPLSRPRSVHWSGRDIYPARLSPGRRLRGINFVESWSESGINYEVTVPSLTGNVAFTRFPVWVVNPLLMEIIVSGFSLWRSHERFTGAYSFPFRMRRMSMCGSIPKEGSQLKCYLRLTGVTPKSHLCDIVVSDGNGKQLASISGWEELTERVPAEYREFIMQPALGFLSAPVSADILGSPATDISSAFVTDVPYKLFERNEELWLRTLSSIVLSGSERREFAEMTGSASRRTEWLFGRIAAKEAVRRFLKDYYQARWSDADIKIWADDLGKPHALGAWSEFLTTKLDIAIAHTAQFVVAIASANARVGVDVESTRRDLSEEFTAGVFTHEELELAAQAVNPAQAVIKFWCAKEAVSKALGTGIRYSPREMVVSDFFADSGTISIMLEGAWAEAFKVFKGRRIQVAVKTVRDHALASCFIPASLFSDED